MKRGFMFTHTGGSATNAVANGGEIIPVPFPGGQTTTATEATGIHCTTTVPK